MSALPSQLSDLAWNQVWQVTVVVLIAGLLVRLFCRYKPHLAYLLWLLVIIKCLTPPIWSSPTGIFCWMGAHSTSRVIPALEYQTERVIPGPLPLSASQEADPESTSTTTSKISETEFQEKADNLLNPFDMHFSLASTIGFIWIGGLLVYASIVIGIWLRWFLKMRNTIAPTDPNLIAFVSDLSKRLGVKQNVRIVVTTRLQGPVVYGLFRPTLLLPAFLLSERSPQQIESVLAHELNHIRRKDAVIGYVQLFTQILWWFHPLIWWANRQASCEKERCCDQEVIARLGCKPDHYAQSLLDVIKLKKRLQPAFAFPGISPEEITSKRLEAIMKPARRFQSRTPIWCWLVILIISAMILPGQEIVPIMAEEQNEITNTNASSIQENTSSTMTFRLLEKGPGHDFSSPPSWDGQFVIERYYKYFLLKNLQTNETKKISYDSPDSNSPEYGYSKCIVISPDNSKCVYQWYNQYKHFSELHLINLDNSNRRILYSEKDVKEIYPMAWTADGQEILALSYRWKYGKDNQILLLSEKNGSIIYEKSMEQWPLTACISPDGKWILYDRNNDSQYDIFAINIEEQKEMPIFQSRADEKLLGWSPDGKWIFYTSDRLGSHDAYIIAVDGQLNTGEIQLIKRNFGEVNPKGFSKNGSFAFEMGYSTSEVCVDGINIENKELISQLKTIKTGEKQYNYAQWSSGGEKIAFYSYYDEEETILFIWSRGAGEMKEIPLPKGYFFEIDWSSKEDAILAIRTLGNETSVCEIDIQSGDVKEILNDPDSLINGFGGWVSERNSFIYRKKDRYKDSQSASILLHDINSHKEEEIVKISSDDVYFYFSISPDGKWLALIDESDKNKSSLLFYPIKEKAEPKELLTISEINVMTDLVWPHNSEAIYYIQKNDLWKISMHGGEPHKVYSFSQRPSSYSIHPDGNQIVFTRGGRVHETWLMENLLPSE